jgi:hypothetical protein
MPAYNAAVIPNSISPGDVATVWNAETPAAGAGGASASAQVALATAVSQSSSVHFDGKFSGAPGAFEVDCQVADVDADANYQTLANLNIATVDAVNNTFHAEAVTDARFARMLMRSRTNAVSITGTIGR